MGDSDAMLVSLIVFEYVSLRCCCMYDDDERDGEEASIVKRDPENGFRRSCLKVTTTWATRVPGLLGEWWPG
jgi:hypothetical protein